jgi:hypothetical protein
MMYCTGWSSTAAAKASADEAAEAVARLNIGRVLVVFVGGMEYKYGESQTTDKQVEDGEGSSKKRVRSSSGVSPLVPRGPTVPVRDLM